MSKRRVYLGLGLVSATFLMISVTASQVMETYKDPLDQISGSLSHTTEIVKKDDSTSSEEDGWNFKSKYKSAKEAIEGYKEFAIREAAQSFVLLKNESLSDTAKSLPLKSSPKVTLFGNRSYAPYYGNSGGSMADFNTVSAGNTFVEALTNKGFSVNPSTVQVYKNFFSNYEWGEGSYGNIAPQYKGTVSTTDPMEVDPSTFSSTTSSTYSNYSDAAIVVFGRIGGENVTYKPGADGLGDGVSTTTGNIFSLTTEEKAVLAEAKKCSKNVIVLINSVCAMDVAELEEDDDVKSVMWIGYPGAYGAYALADVLTGVTSPSGHLGDTYAKNNAVCPAMQNFGDIPWTNKDSYTSDDNVNSYLIDAEGIYQGYRYYETRYEDAVLGKGEATTAKAGTYTNKDGTVSTTSGTWDYSNEVVYPFGAGLSYTTFEQTLDSVNISSDRLTAEVKVTVKNTGSVAGRDAVELYAQSPYTQYDIDNKVEKSAIQLMDYEKTDELAAGESQTITMHVDMSNIASYDYTKAKTFIIDQNATYYFALGNDAHDALNNVLAAKGYTSSSNAAMTSDGDASKTYSWQWNGSEDVDDITFSKSDTGEKITNKLSEGEFAMDLNGIDGYENTVTYLTRNQWNTTYPKTYSGLTAKGDVDKMLKNDFYELHSNDDVSSVTFGDTTSTLTINDLKGVTDFDDPRYEEVANKVTIADFLTFSTNAFHNLEGLPSAGFAGGNADDGPGGSDSHYFSEGSYQGVAWSDRSNYTGEDGKEAKYGTRVCPSQENLAYTWSKELAFENGEIIIGETSLCLNIPLIIGPAGNLHRHNYGGRGGEYYSEDPILSGYTGSASVQGAQSKGCLVNVKHAAFNDQEKNRSGIAIFSNEQKARELELRNLNQMLVGKGKPASFYGDSTKDNTYTLGALGIMTSYNRIGAVASSGNKAVMQDIIRDEWGFKGYNVTDFTNLSMKAAPKESLLYGTVAFCGFGGSVSYYNEETLSKDLNMCKAIHQNIKYILYSVANSNALNGVTSDSYVITVQLMTWWRGLYSGCIIGFSILTFIFTLSYVLNIKSEKKEEIEE